MKVSESHKALGDREKRILARWISAFLPEVVEDMKQDGDPMVPLAPEELETPRFKFGHEVHDEARCRHQMQHEVFQIARRDNHWLAEETVRCPRCGKVSIGPSISACSGCGMSIPRRQMVDEETDAPGKHSRALALFGALGIAIIIALGVTITQYLAKENQEIASSSSTEKARQTVIPGDWRTIRSALKVVHHFHQATSVEEKASLVRDFEGRREALIQHYKETPFEPSHIESIIKTGWHEVEGLVSYLIHGSYADGNQFLAYVCEQDGQLALDWQAFTGHNTLPFTAFLDQESQEPSTMRVVAQGLSVEPVPELAPDYRFYQLHDKDRKDTCWALVRKHSEAGQTLASLIARPDSPSFSLFSTTSDIATETSKTPPRRLMLKLRYDDSLGIVIDEVVSAEWLDQPVPADIHFDA